MTNRSSSPRTRRSRKQIEALISPAAENATSVAELGLVGHAPIDSAIYTMSESAEPPIAPTLTQEEIDALAAALGDDKLVPSGTSELTPVEPNSFDAVLAGFTEDQVLGMVDRTAIALDERADFERTKNPDNTNIQRTLKKAREQMVTKRAAKVLLACNVTPEVFNRTIHEGQRYNVYAVGKLADVIFGVTDKGLISNAINLACMRSLFRFRAAGKMFTGELAKAAASDKVRGDAIAAVKDHLVRYTVSASTAPTQASSTMQAFETLGIVKKSGTHKNPNFELSDSPIVSKLEGMLAKAA